MEPMYGSTNAITGARGKWIACPREEFANAATHGLGLLLSAVGLVLVVRTCMDTSPLTFIGCLIYAVSLVMLYGASTAYHLARDYDWKRRLQVADHMCIYLLIAGTYTPFTLTLMKSPLGYAILAAVWILAAIGITIKLFHTGKCDGLSTLAYVLMGWIALVAIDRVIAVFPMGAILWLLAGGLFYTGGVIFYRLDHKVRYFHAIWHLFVMAGSACQYIAVLQYAARHD